MAYERKSFAMVDHQRSEAAYDGAECLHAPTGYCGFLKLPPELRICIYRETFGDATVIINSTTFPEPALLLVCGQIREESGPVFYAERKFESDIQDYDSTLYMATLSKKIRVKEEFDVTLPAEVFAEHAPNWNKLLLWLRRAHNGPLRGIPNWLDAETGPDEVAVRSAFACIRQLQDMEWERVEPLLEEIHKILIAIDPRWK